MSSQHREWARILSRESGSLAAENIRRIMGTKLTATERAAIIEFSNELTDLRHADDRARFARS